MKKKRKELTSKITIRRTRRNCTFVFVLLFLVVVIYSLFFTEPVIILDKLIPLEIIIIEYYFHQK
jgi:hypothetical protein